MNYILKIDRTDFFVHFLRQNVAMYTSGLDLIRYPLLLLLHC